MRRRLALLLAAAAAVASACGVRPDSEPRRIDGVSIVVPSRSGDGSVAGPTAVVVYFVRNAAAIPVRRLVSAPATLGSRLDILGRGPNDREAEAGLRTALTGNIRAESVAESGGTAVVTLAASFVDAGTQEQILALTQLVFTLTELPSISGVRFLVGGTPVSVPRADGSLTDSSVGRADYAPRVTPPGS